MKKIVTKILDWIKVKKNQKYTVWIFSSIFFILICINSWVIYWSHNFIHKNAQNVPTCYTGLILVAFINQQGVPSHALKDHLIKVFHQKNN